MGEGVGQRCLSQQPVHSCWRTAWPPLAKAPCTRLPRKAHSAGSMPFLISKTEREDSTVLIIHEVWDSRPFLPPSKHDSKSQSDSIFHNTKYARAQDQASTECSPQGKPADLFSCPLKRAYSQKGRRAIVQKVPVIQPDRFQVLPYRLGGRACDSVTAVFTGAGLYGGLAVIVRKVLMNCSSSSQRTECEQVG